MIEQNGFGGKLYDLSEKVMRLAYLNILWIAFTLLGAVILGFFPATVSMFTVVRKWAMGDSEIPIFKTFWQTYRKEFLKINQLGLILVGIGYLLFLDMMFFKNTVGPTLQPLFYVLLVLFIIYFVVILYIFPVYVHYNFKIIESIKYAFIMGVGRLFQTALMILCSIGLYYFFIFIPGLIPFFSGSVLSLTLMSIAKRSFPQMNDA